MLYRECVGFCLYTVRILHYQYIPRALPLAVEFADFQPATFK